MTGQTITVQNVDIDLLRIQLNTLLATIDRLKNQQFDGAITDNLNGLVNLIEALLDSAELLPEPLPALLRRAAKTLGTHNPEDSMCYIEEDLTGEQYKIVFDFLTWLKDNDYTFGHNIQEVYKAFRTGDTSKIQHASELRAKLPTKIVADHG